MIDKVHKSWLKHADICELTNRIDTLIRLIEMRDRMIQRWGDKGGGAAKKHKA